MINIPNSELMHVNRLKKRKTTKENMEGPTPI
jgi:hypothetical protein